MVSSIVVSAGLGAAGAVVGAGAALAIKNYFIQEDKKKPDRQSCFLDREIHVFGATNKSAVAGTYDPFDHMDVTLEFDDVGDDVPINNRL